MYKYKPLFIYVLTDITLKDMNIYKIFKACILKFEATIIVVSLKSMSLFYYLNF